MKVPIIKIHPRALFTTLYLAAITWLIAFAKSYKLWEFIMFAVFAVVILLLYISKKYRG